MRKESILHTAKLIAVLIFLPCQVFAQGDIKSSAGTFEEPESGAADSSPGSGIKAEDSGTYEKTRRRPRRRSAAQRTKQQDVGSGWSFYEWLAEEVVTDEDEPEHRDYLEKADDIDSAPPPDRRRIPDPSERERPEKSVKEAPEREKLPPPHKEQDPVIPDSGEEEDEILKETEVEQISAEQVLEERGVIDHGLSALPERLVMPADSTEIFRLWEKRKKAVADLDFEKQEKINSRMVELRRELGIRSLNSMGEALIREGYAHLDRNDPLDALVSAELAVGLAPDLPSGRWFLAKSMIRANPAGIPGAIMELLHAFYLELTGVPHRRIHLVNLASILYLSIMTAGLCFLGLTVMRRGRHYIHDFAHLPVFPGKVARIPVMVLAVSILISPVLMRAGPALLATVLTAAVWLHSSSKERLVFFITLVMLAGAPHVTKILVQYSAFSETPAEVVWRIERAGGDIEALRKLEERYMGKDTTWIEIFALARFYQREGRLTRAVDLYREALEKEPRNAMIHNNIGVALFAMQDFGGAANSFRAATETDSSMAGAWHNLSKVYFIRGERVTGQEARRRAIEIDGSIMDRYPDPENRLNLALYVSELSDAQIFSLARTGADLPDHAYREATLRLAGLFGSGMLPLLPVVVFPLMALGSLLSKWRPSAACVKCGRVVCRKCESNVQSGILCGQCVSISKKKLSVSQRARLIKEAAIRRYQALRKTSINGIGLLLPGANHVLLDNTIKGAILLCLFFFGLGNILFSGGPFPSMLIIDPMTWIRTVIGIICVAFAWFNANSRLWKKEQF